MPPDTPRDDDDGPQHVLGLQPLANRSSSTGLLPWASGFFTMPQMPSSSTNVTLFNEASHVEVYGQARLVTAYNYVSNTYGGNSDLLDVMKPSVLFGALHDSYADDPEHRCHPGTRQYVLKRLQGWIDDVTSTERISWLHGTAGSGKSAIAHTIADSNGKDKVAATFFFCRSDPERNNGNRLFITLAWQLALSIPFLKSHIIQSLNKDPGLLLRSVETQFRELIVQPFQEIVHSAASQSQLPSLVVIIDGIDECIDENLQRRILAVIVNAASNVHVPLRFLVSSRLEAHIKRAFDQFKCPILCMDLRLEKFLARQRNSSSKHTLKQLQDWVDNPSSVERISWLRDPASSVRSAMAQTVADLNERKKVVATFFFQRFDATRNDGTRLFPTLCWQFASSISSYKDYIIQYLAQCSSLPSQDVQCQFHQLIVEPFEALKAVESQEQPLDHVVIIDGVDECADPKIQRELLQVIIGSAVRTRRVPVRFLIASRSEGLIQEAIHFFQCPVLSINLGIVPLGTRISENLPYHLRIAPGKDREGYRYRSSPFGSFFEPASSLMITDDCLEDHDIVVGVTPANIKDYLKTEFSRIAIEQELGETWPGQQVIQDLAHRSSGHFIYASTIVKLFYSALMSAEALLNLIQDLQPRTESPFAHLDELYAHILKWQSDQVSLKNALALIVVRTSILEGYEDLWEDDAVIMSVSKQELQIKLWRMRSLLDLEPYIDVHHQSFLDFLQDASRSGQYHISKEEGLRRYLNLITGSLVQYVNNVLNQPEYHEIHHFEPRFSQVVKEYPRRIELPVAEWQEVLQPLLKLGRKSFISCAKCTAVRIIRDLLLHFAFLRGISSIRSREPAVDEAEEFEEHIDDTTVIEDSLHNCLSPLLAHLRGPRSQSGPTDTEIIKQMCTVLYFDCVEIVARIPSLSDAQNLVDVIVDMLDEKLFLNQCDPDTDRKAILLVLEIYAKIPVLPRSLFLEGSARDGIEKWNCRNSEIEILCQSALIGKILKSEYIIPVLGVCEEEGKFTFVGGNGYEKSMSLSRWRRRANTSSETVIPVMLGVAKAFRYLHSMGVILHYDTDSDDIFLDSDLSPTIRFWGSFLLYIVKTPSICLEARSKVLMTREANVFKFGCLFYEMSLNVEIAHEDRIPHEGRIRIENRVDFARNIKRPTEPEIPDNVWNLIQLCCGEDPKRRPTMEEVVMEMERWGLPPLPAPQKDAPPEDKSGSKLKDSFSE